MPRGEAKGKWRRFLDSLYAQPNIWGRTPFRLEYHNAKQIAYAIRKNIAVVDQQGSYPGGFWMAYWEEVQPEGDLPYWHVIAKFVPEGAETDDDRRDLEREGAVQGD